jgi:mannitol/fructose-specific phosphotransferase system IIA component (Ntr-type)
MHRDIDRLKELAKPRDFRRTLSSITSVRTLPMREKRDILIPESVIMRLTARTKDDVLRELVRKLDGGSLPMKSEADILASIAEREAADPTELEYGVFMPHGRCEALNGVAAAVGLCPEGMDFDCLDGSPVRLAIMVASPKNTSGPHLYFLATLTAALRTREMVDMVVSAETPEEVVRLLIGEKDNRNFSLMERLMSGPH